MVIEPEDLPEHTGKTKILIGEDISNAWMSLQRSSVSLLRAVPNTLLRTKTA